MGCASSAPLVVEQPAPASTKRHDASTHKETVETRGAGPTNQELTFARELPKLISEAVNSTKPKEPWAVLFRCADLICSAFGVRTCSLVIYTPSGQHCKLACNGGSVLNELVAQHPDLLPAAAMGWVSRAVETGKTACIKAGDDQWSALRREPLPDFAALTGEARGGCSALAVLPLLGGQPDGRCPGALLLGHTVPLAGMAQESWLTTLLPLLSLYVSESSLVRNLGLVERAVSATSINSLAYAVTELGEVFDWVHREEVEARLVVLSPEGDTATVYCRSLGAFMGTGGSDDRASIRSGMSGSQGHRSGQRSLVPEDVLVGTHMSLENTLTKRCLTGRLQRLLFVADVMQALKLYGEPWKDIFFDNAAVLTPAWVLAAPLVQDGTKLGAVLWLSSARVNSEVLMRTASTCASPIIHAVARATAIHRLTSSCERAERCHPEAAPLGPAASLTATGGAASASGADGMGSGGGGRILSSYAHMAGGGGGGAGGSRMSSTSQAGGRRAGASGADELLLAARGSVDTGTGGTGGTGGTCGTGGGSRGGERDCSALRMASPLTDVPVKYVLRHSPSTSALMRMYKSTIAQRAPHAEEDALAGSVHEIRILSKAGEGAFGSVYVGRWRNLVVAVKIIQGHQRRAVHAILTDVHLQKSSTRVLRFVPAAALEAQQAAAALAAAAASAVGAGNSSCGTGCTNSNYTAGTSIGNSFGASFVASAGVGAGGGGSLNGHGVHVPSRLSVGGGNGSTGGGTATRAVLTAGAAAAAAGAVAVGEPVGGALQLPTKASAPPTPVGALSNGGHGGIGGVGSLSYSVPTPGLSGVGGAVPSLARMSAGSISQPPCAAMLQPKPLTPRVHAILMEYCNLGGLHKYIDNRMFFRDRSQPPPTQLPQADSGTEAGSPGGPPLPPESLHMDYILATLSEVASALQYLHSQGFVHCDLKPENVLLKEAANRRGFTAKLADFGLSELRSADGQVVGDLGGTVTHVAPESVLHRQVSAASDMYAFGVLMCFSAVMAMVCTCLRYAAEVLRELYTGQQPYRSLLSHISKREDRHRALLARVVHEGLRPLFPTGVPQCWSADPAVRPTTSEALTALEAMYARHALPSAPPA
ncbi:hypothetical protein GPECTOR_10g1030 [Gonium pectorale]|uniref:Protein kinase domain-containing protein n=1 Tax=Gonium pectorale TaxID=33097 RepID=A0A150GQJ8_GONPE|nr:hypothetical protein GPECTOR_10g1030 [Gonium pectorale]|eukprot:KXZ52008.1 hypothetical protein GPECTOR_10g1030 [Gonium pectorale]